MTKTSNNRRAEIADWLRLQFEKTLPDNIRREIDGSRDQREELLAERIEERFREDFEEPLRADINRETEDTRAQREEILAEQVEELLREQFEEKLPEAIDEILEAGEELAA